MRLANFRALVLNGLAVVVLTIGGWPNSQPAAIAQEATAAATDALPAMSLEYVPADALAVAFLYPQEVLSSPEMELMPLEIAQAWGIDNIGVDLMKIDSLTACAGVPGPAGVNYGVVIRLSEDLNPRLLNREMFAGAAVEINGYQAIPLAEVPGTYLHRIDPKTYLLASANYLAAMRDADGKTGPLQNMMATQTRSTPFVMGMVFAPIRPQLQQVAGQMPPGTPGPLADMIEIPQMAEGMILEGSGGASGKIRLSMVGESEAEAEQIRTVLLDGLNFGSQMAVMQAIQQIDGNDRVAEASRKYVQRLAGSITEMLNPVRNGNLVQIEVEASGGLAFTGVAVGMLLPAVQAAREAARRMQSSNNLKQIMLSLHNYESTYRKFPAAISRDADGKPLLSWRVAILPYVEQQALYEEFHLDEPWDSEHNIKLLERMPPTFSDPSAPIGPGMTTYHAVVGEGLGFEPDQQGRFRDITDGTSNTIAVFESSLESAVPWTKPEDAEIDLDDPLANMGDYRPGGFNVGMFDGSIRFMANSIDVNVFRSLLTRAGGEVVNIN